MSRSSHSGGQKVLLVVGGATGIGAEVVRQMSAAGTRAAICDINEADGRALAAEVGGAFFHGDASDHESLGRAIGHCVTDLGVPDYALLNSGVMTAPSNAPFMSVEDAPLEAYRRVMSINVDGVFFGLRHLLPLMREAGGAITVTASRAGLVPTPPDAIYAASKAAAIHFVRSVAQGNSNPNLRINALCPATVDTTLVATVVRMAGVPLISAADMAREAVELLREGANGEVRVKLHDKPSFAVGTFDANLEYREPGRESE